MCSSICQSNKCYELLHRNPSPVVPHTCNFPHQVWCTISDILHPIHFLTLQFTLIIPCDHPLHGSSSTVTEQFLYKLCYYCIFHDCHHSISAVTIMIQIHVIPTQSVASAACPNFDQHGLPDVIISFVETQLLYKDYKLTHELLEQYRIILLSHQRMSIT